jgi:hypothetical protein
VVIDLGAASKRAGKEQRRKRSPSRPLSIAVPDQPANPSWIETPDHLPRSVAEYNARSHRSSLATTNGDDVRLFRPRLAEHRQALWRHRGTAPSLEAAASPLSSGLLLLLPAPF